MKWSEQNHQGFGGHHALVLQLNLMLVTVPCISLLPNLLLIVSSFHMVLATFHKYWICDLQLESICLQDENAKQVQALIDSTKRQKGRAVDILGTLICLLLIVALPVLFLLLPVLCTKVSSLLNYCHFA